MVTPDDLIVGLDPINVHRARYYHKGNGIPSVTELLSFIDCQGLINWANVIGRKGLDNKEVAKTAARYGTNTHSAIENFLRGKEPFVKNSSFEAFKLWWHKINEENDRVVILGSEESLVGDYFAGTYDLLLSINDVPYLVDFKTSNSVSYKYFMQLAAYRNLLYTTKGINVRGCIVLHLHKGPKAKYTEYKLDFSNPYDYEFIETCMKCFAGLVYTYYHVYHAKEQFDDAFKHIK